MASDLTPEERETLADVWRNLPRMPGDPDGQLAAFVRAALAAVPRLGTGEREGPSLDALVPELVQWQAETFKDATVHSKIAHLVEEVVELAQAPHDAEEYADCFMLLTGAAHVAGVDLASAVRDKLAVNRARQWGEPDEHGVVRHVTPAPASPEPEGDHG
ncbi:MAG: dATP/dGTP pyrophosphohydrolase domain-containing protein [Gemmatimonadales bacterium]